MNFVQTDSTDSNLTFVALQKKTIRRIAVHIFVSKKTLFYQYDFYRNLADFLLLTI